MRLAWMPRGACLFQHREVASLQRFFLSMQRLCLYLGLAALWLLTGCCERCLKVQTDYLTHKDLASYYVNTPDPRQNVSAVGQRLIIGWVVPKPYLSYDDLHLEITIRFRNKEEIIEIFHLLKTRGTYVFSLFNEDYFQKRGILTYKVNLIGNGCILEEWRHQIWADFINVNAEAPSVDTRDAKQDAEQQSCEPANDDYPIDWNDPEF